MSIIKGLSINGNKGTTITVGDNNEVTTSQKFLETSVSQVNHDINWNEIISHLQELQSTIKKLPDEFEDIRDQELIPELSKVKSEAKRLAEDPDGDNKSFIQKFSNLFNIASKATNIAKDLMPILTNIGAMVGIEISK